MSAEMIVMCVGNRDGGDDAVGPYVADMLGKKGNEILVVDCGTTPENYTSVVKKHHPALLVLIDAANMGLQAGEIRKVPKDRLGRMHISTHGIPLSVLMKYLEPETGRIVFIGVQPQTMSGKMSTPVKQSADRLIELILKEKIDSIPEC